MSRAARDALGLFAISVFACALFTQGSIRSPDGEVAFRSARALAQTGSFAVDEELAWKGFGLSTGRDGGRYSIFGPLLPLVAAPWVWMGEAVAATGLFTEHNVPVSFYIGQEDRIFDKTVADPRPHVVRSVVSLLNALATGAGVVFLYWIALALCGSRAGAWTAALCYGLGSIALPYASPFLSEPLATALVLASFALLLRGASGESSGHAAYAMAGLLLGLAALAHITAVLFAPFFAAAAWSERSAKRGRVQPVALYLIGFALPLLWLAAFNFDRFGSPFETGRTMPDSGGFGYGVFVDPLDNISGLLFSFGKGLFLFCPAVLLALFGVRSMVRERPALVAALAGAALLRIVFIAARSDWHGGFGVGPRYLMMLVPFLLLPLAFLARDVFASRSVARLAAVGGALLACILQQFYFSLHDIFTYGHMLRVTGGRQNFNVFENDFIYLAWEISPLYRLHEIGVSSYALSRTGLDLVTLLVLLGCIVASGLAWRFYLFARETPPSVST